MYEASQAVGTSNLSFKDCFRRAAAGLAILDGGGYFVEVNPAFCEMFGRASDLFRHLRFQDLVPAEERAATCAQPHCLKAVLGGAGVREMELRRPDGSTVLVRMSLFQAGNGDGGEGHAVVTCEDITRQGTAEVALRELQDEYTYAIEFSPHVPWTADAEGHIFKFSDRWMVLTGLAEDASGGEGWMEVPHPEDLDLMRERWRRSVASGDPYDVEHRIRLPTGEERWMRSRAFARRDEAGRISRWYGSTEDIQDRKLAEHALLQSEKLAVVGRLASSIAHEINNPLEAVTNLLYLARTSREVPGEVLGYLEAAEAELARVSLITNQTLRFHKQSTRRAAVSCLDLIGGSLSIFRGRLASSGIEVEKRKRACKRVTCFEGEIRQVLNNLIGNAVDACPRTGGRLLLRSRDATDWRTGRKGLVITVADNGAGMSLETQKKVFEPFFTTKEIGGTGLGLWISREIIERHKGQLRMRSSQRPGRSGSTFTVFLPLTDDEEPCLAVGEEVGAHE